MSILTWKATWPTVNRFPPLTMTRKRTPRNAMLAMKMLGSVLICLPLVKMMTRRMMLLKTPQMMRTMLRMTNTKAAVDTK